MTSTIFSYWSNKPGIPLPYLQGPKPPFYWVKKPSLPWVNPLEKHELAALGANKKLEKATEITTNFFHIYFNSFNGNDIELAAQYLNDLHSVIKECEMNEEQRALFNEMAKKISQEFKEKLEHNQNDRSYCMALLADAITNSIPNFNVIYKSKHYIKTLEMIRKLQSEKQEKEAELHAAELIHEEEKNHKRKSRIKKKRSHSQYLEKRQELKPCSKQTFYPIASPIVGSCTSSSPDLIIKTFFASLLHNCQNYRIHSRVKRWEESDLPILRSFVDKVGGEKICRYSDYSNSELEYERAKHLLFGVERILQYKIFYAFVTDRGYGIPAELTFNGKKKTGIIYIGCGEDKVIYHKYFKEVNFEQLNDDVFFENDEELTDETCSFKEDLPSFLNAMQITSNDGILEFFYDHNYKVRVFPLNKQLLDLEIPKSRNVII